MYISGSSAVRAKKRLTKTYMRFPAEKGFHSEIHKTVFPSQVTLAALGFLSCKLSVHFLGGAQSMVFFLCWQCSFADIPKMLYNPRPNLKSFTFTTETSLFSILSRTIGAWKEILVLRKIWKEWMPNQRSLGWRNWEPRGKFLVNKFPVNQLSVIRSSVNNCVKVNAYK